MGVSLDYEENGKIVSRKPHACGGNEWTILRVGAEYKIKCDKCKRIVFVPRDKIDKVVKSYERR